MQKLEYSPWAKFCGKGSAPGATEVCTTGTDARTQAGQPAVAVGLIEPEGEAKKLLRVTLPPYAYDTRIIIDKEPPIRSTFSTCFANGCMADYEATPELIDKLKKGQMLQVLVTYLGTFLALPLPLAHSTQNSFAGANEGPPADPKVFEKQQPKRCNLDTLYWCRFVD